MIKIKVTSDNLPYYRHFSKSIMNDGHLFYLIDDYGFVFNDSSFLDCDYWLILYSEGLKIEENCVANCSPNNIYFVLGEVENIHIYNEKFIKQFANIISAQNHTYKGVNNIKTLYFASWYNGLVFDKNGFTGKYRLTYDSFKEMPIINKDRLISVICSNKQFTSSHGKRLDFTRKLKEYFGDCIDFYGRGINDFKDKWDVLSPYKYTIVLENFSQSEYATEKIVDAHLAQCYPIYYGCDNLDSYIPNTSFSRIDINNENDAIKIIENIINGNYYEKYLYDIIVAKDLWLEKFDMFRRFVEIIKKQNLQNSIGDKKKIIIRQEIEFDLNLQIKNFIKKLLPKLF